MCSPGFPNWPPRPIPFPNTWTASLDDEVLYLQVSAKFSRHYPRTLHHDRHSTLVKAILWLLRVKHLNNWHHRETA